jgi:hypothetical protein
MKITQLYQYADPETGKWCIAAIMQPTLHNEYDEVEACERAAELLDQIGADEIHVFPV